MIRVAIMGAAGRMGTRLTALSYANEDIMISGALETEGHDSIGHDAGLVAGVGPIGVPISDDMAQALRAADAIIDFTVPMATLEAARYAAENGKVMVIGTTGFSTEQTAELEALAAGFPCVFSPNMSVGVNVMFSATRRLAELLGEDYEVEIIEAHHKHKVDAPSGTALKLAEIVADVHSRDLDEVGRFERWGPIGPRPATEIGIQTIRGGDIVGEHTVMFIGSGERIELIHRTTTRDNFASGALRALRWVATRKPGLYTMDDVLGI